jgi:MFS family permease
MPTPLSSRPFRVFFLGRLISILGSAMTPVTLALSVLNASGQPAGLGVVMACQIFPQLVLLAVGGAAGDRFPRRTVLMVSNLGAGLTQAGVAAILLTGNYSLAAIAALSVAYGAIDAFTSPALRGVIPELVARDDTQRANSLLAAAQNGARILGPTAGGLFVVGVGGGWAIALDALSFIIAAAFFTRLPASPGQTGTAAPARRRGLLADIADGWREFRAIPWLAAMSVSFCFLNLVNVGPWQILGPDLTRQHGSEAAWGVVLSVRAIGLFAMSTVMYKLALRRPLRDTAVIGVFGALPLLALGLGASTPWLAACAFIGALGFTAKGIAYDTTLQQHVPRHVLSRIAAIDDLPSYAAVAAGELLTGPVATAVGARTEAFCCGIIYAVANTAPLAVRSVRHLGTANDVSLGVTGGERALSEICESYSKATKGATDASVHRRRRGRRRTAPRPHADDGRP